ncbi:MAG TPA: DUF882 domain-containing protein [Polyangia bacterium]|jgi:uncharacterized protein YcbK (DUF882 family)|nr:DUF882 domain-containing protein [Polyangia bacterium]
MADARRSGPELERIRREAGAPRRERLRIVIASDASRPIRTFTLPRGLPRAVTIVALLLVATTAALLAGSWHMNGSLHRLDERVQAMVQAADTVAMHPLPGTGDEVAIDAKTGAMSGAGAHTPAGQKGHFVVRSVNTGEELEVRLDLASGEVEATSYRALRHLMRCQRTGAETPMDPRLIELLYRIATRTRQKIELVSGFRAPMFSLATLSYHTRGMAADIRVPGMTPLMVRDLARAMGVKGIGYYPVSQFVHVDVRDEHQEWTDFGENRLDAEGGEHDPSHADATP